MKRTCLYSGWKRRLWGYGNPQSTACAVDSSFAKGAFWTVRARMPSEYEPRWNSPLPNAPFLKGGGSALALTGDCLIKKPHHKACRRIALSRGRFVRRALPNVCMLPILIIDAPMHQMKNLLRISSLNCTRLLMTSETMARIRQGTHTKSDQYSSGVCPR